MYVGTERHLPATMEEESLRASPGLAIGIPSSEVNGMEFLSDRGTRNTFAGGVYYEVPLNSKRCVRANAEA